MYTSVYVLVEARRGYKTFRSWSYRYCELPDMGAGIFLQILWKTYVPLFFLLLEPKPIWGLRVGDLFHFIVYSLLWRQDSALDLIKW